MVNPLPEGATMDAYIGDAKVSIFWMVNPQHLVPTKGLNSRQEDRDFHIRMKGIRMRNRV